MKNVTAFLTLAVCLGLAPLVRANGALPATIRVLAPATAPKTLILTTNFGLITTTDDGATWRWACEHDLGDQGSAYQLGADGRLYSLSTAGIVTSVDLGCTWSLVMDDSFAIALDYFPDPSDPKRMLAVGILRSMQRTFAVLDVKLNGTAPATVNPLYTAMTGPDLTTVEVSRSNPQVMYATQLQPNLVGPGQILRSGDGGKTWTSATAPADVPQVGILGVDSSKPDKLYLRVVTTANDGDELRISEDGGKTLRKALAPMMFQYSFLQLPNGHLLVGYLGLDRGYLYRSTDGGVTFDMLPTELHPRSLAERAGKLYLANDSLADEQVISVSEDEGQTWKTLMKLDQVVAANNCPGARSLCTTACRTLQSRNVFQPAACAPLGAAAPDAGAPDADAPARPDAPRGVDIIKMDAGLAPPPPPPKSGCSCALSAARPPSAAWLLVAAAAILRRLRRLRRR
jgi:hypothetical protein